MEHAINQLVDQLITLFLKKKSFTIGVFKAFETVDRSILMKIDMYIIKATLPKCFENYLTY